MEALKKARDRHVEVYIYTNTETPTQSVALSKTNLKQFHAWGCKIYGDGLNHSKCVVSESEGIIFTANIDCVSGMTSGFEVGCMLTDSQRLSAIRHIKLQIDRICQQRTRPTNKTTQNNKARNYNKKQYNNGRR